MWDDIFFCLELFIYFSSARKQIVVVAVVVVVAVDIWSRFLEWFWREKSESFRLLILVKWVCFAAKAWVVRSYHLSYIHICIMFILYTTYSICYKYVFLIFVFFLLFWMKSIFHQNVLAFFATRSSLLIYSM